MNRKFPQYLSKPIQILWFDLDEVMIFLFFLTLCLVYGGYLWFILLPAQYLYIRTKKKNPRGFFKHILYAMGFIVLEGYPEFFEKEFSE